MNIKQVIISSFLFLALLGCSGTGNAQTFRIREVRPHFAKQNDTLMVRVSNLDTANKNYELRLGSTPVPIIARNDSSLTTVMPKMGYSAYVFLYDTTQHTSARSSYPVFVDFADTAVKFANNPSLMLKREDKIQLYNPSSPPNILGNPDVDGDGRTDIIVTVGNNTYILLNRITVDWDIKFDTILLPRYQLFAGQIDVDGQGLLEVVLSAGPSSAFTFYRFQEKSGKLAVRDSFTISPSYQYHLADLNCDGKTDYYYSTFYGTYPNVKFGIEYGLNQSADTLGFSKPQKLDLDSLRFPRLFEYTDSNSIIMLASRELDSIRVIEILNDSSGLKVKRLSAQPTATRWYPTESVDFNFDGRYEVLSIYSSSKTVMGLDTTNAFEMLTYNRDGVEHDQSYCVMTRPDSTYYRFSRAGRNLTPIYLARLNADKDSIYRTVVQNLHYDFENCRFTDLNNDGYADAFQGRFGYLFPNKILHLTGRLPLDTVYFLYDSLNQTIFHHGQYVLNTGQGTIQIDSVSHDSSYEFLALDSSALSFPIKLNSGDTLQYLIRFKSNASTPYRNQSRFIAGTLQFAGPNLKAKLDSNPPFEIKEITPTRFTAKDTISIILAGFRGSYDSTFVMFNNSKATVDTLIGDTLRVIAPKYFSDAVIKIMDAKNGLVRQSARSYSMATYNHGGKSLDKTLFEDTRDYHGNVRFRAGTGDYMMEDYMVVDYNSSGITYYYRSVGDNKEFENVGIDSISTVWNRLWFQPADFDDKVDGIYLDYKNAQFVVTRNKGNKNDSLPLDLDSLYSIRIPKVGSFYPEAFTDLDGDGLEDMVLRRAYGKDSTGIYIRSRQFDDKPYSFSSGQFIKMDQIRNVLFHDLDADGKRDILIYRDTSIVFLKNESRRGHIKFTEHDRLYRPRTGVHFTLAGAKDLLHDNRLLLTEYNDLKVLMVNMLTLQNGKLKVDSIIHYDSWGTIASIRTRFGDLDGNGTLDMVVGTYVIMNHSDSSGLKLDSAVRIAGPIEGGLVDVNGDHILDIVESDEVYLNLARNAKILSVMDTISHRATQPRFNDHVFEPTVLVSQEGDSLSLVDPIWVWNNGILPFEVTNISKATQLEISDTTSFAALQIPFTVQPGEKKKLYLRSNNKVHNQPYIDTMVFEIDTGIVVREQIVYHLFRNPPVIDSLSSYSVDRGDTVHIYGKNLISITGIPNQVTHHGQELKIVSASDSIYSVIMRSDVVGSPIRMVDTINHLGASSATQVWPRYDGPGGDIGLNYFRLDTTFVHTRKSIWDHWNYPQGDLQMFDMNGDGQLDLLGRLGWFSGGSSFDYSMANFNKSSDPDRIDVKPRAVMGSTRAGSSQLPYSMSYYLDDVDRDGRQDNLHVDYGSNCNMANTMCTGFHRSNPLLDTNYNIRAYRQQSYPYRDRFDERAGAADIYGDFNNDGIPELIHTTDSHYIITHISDYYTYRMEVNTAKTASTLAKYELDTLVRKPKQGWAHSVTDFDGDGKVDFIDGALIMLNTSDSSGISFKPAYHIVDSFHGCSPPQTPNYRLRTNIVDLNGDGKPDLMGDGTSMCYGFDSWATLINESTPGNLKFKFKQMRMSAGSQLTPSFADINGDGLTDFVNAYPSGGWNKDDSLFIVTNVSDTSIKFSIKRYYLTGITDVHAQDFNNDGTVDMVLVRRTGSYVQQLRFYKNNALAGKMSREMVRFNIPEHSQDSTTAYFVNSGGFELEIDTIVHSGNNPNLSFSISPGTGKQKLKTDDSISIKLVYRGDSIGTINDTLWVYSNASKGVHQLIVTATTLPWPKVEVRFDTLQFGRVRIGDSAQLSYYIKNTGTDTLVVGGAAVTDSQFEIAGANNKKVPVGDSLHLQCYFRPGKHSKSSSNSFVLHNALSRRLDIFMSGEGIAPITPKSLSQQSDTINYAEVGVDSFYFKNSGNDTLHLLSLTATKYITIQSVDSNIAPSDSGLIRFSYSADTLGSYTQSITIKHDYFKDSVSTVNVSYIGTRGQLKMFNRVQFYRVPKDSSRRQYIALINIGNDSLRIDSFKIAIANTSFGIDSNYSLPLMIPANDTHHLPLKFTGHRAGLCLSDLVVYHNSQDSQHSAGLVAATNVVFDSTRIGDNGEKPYGIFNFTQSSQRVNSPNISDPTNFSEQGLAAVLNSGDSASGKLRFNPTQEGAMFALLTFYPKAGSIVFSAGGFGTSPKVFENKLLSLSPIGLNVRVKDTVFVQNTGSDTLIAKNFASSSQVNLLETFSTVLAGDSGRIIFEYWTNSRSNQSESITFEHNYYKFSKTTIDLTYFGQSPGIFISKSSIDFGDKAIGDQYPDSFYIKNTGNSNLVISKLTYKGDSELAVLTGSPITITPSDRRFVSVEFDPNDRSTYGGEIWIYHSAPGDSARVDMRGKGVGSAIDSCIVLDTISETLGSYVRKDFYVKNTGDLVLSIDSVKLYGKPEINLIKKPGSIAANGQALFTIDVRPQKLSVESDTLIVYHDNYKYSQTKIIVSYRGTDAVGQLSQREIDHGKLGYGKDSERSFVLKNIGLEDLKINFAVFKTNQQFRLKDNPKGSTLEPGDSIVLTTIYTPSLAGVDVDTLSFWTNSQTWKSTNFVRLIGGLKMGELEIIEEPKIVQNVKLGDTIRTSIRVRNNGSDSLRLQGVKYQSNLLSISLPLDQVLDTMEEDELQVEVYANEQKDTHVLGYQIEHTGLDKISKGELHLNTIWPVLTMPDSFHMNNTEINTTNKDTFWVYNTGSDTIEINAVSWWKNSLFADSAIRGLKVVPGDSAPVYLKFSPTALGYFNDSIRLETNDPVNARRKVLVGGVSVKTTGIDKAKIYGNVLFQNIPNPAQDMTSIRYQLSEAKDVEIVLYSSTGQRIATVYSGRANAGMNSVDVKTSDLATGIYFIQLNLEHYSLRRSMIKN